ncbi:DUF2249 domain-containing protein [Paenirhodobacter sp.]|uniref:DUF2249 domain-containing protein n=1 Tax=Paenirhodobacter sp. TaxID=1965326 RepID=UPI003B41BC82
MPEIVTLDVRPIIAGGEEPFAAIISAADALAEGQVLRILAPFRPVPLFRVMERRGFAWEETALGAPDWQVDFHIPEQRLSDGSAMEAAGWAAPSVTLDLTGLEPPQPMMRILATTETLEPGGVLFALLDREPVFLFPQLKERGHQWAGNHDADGTGYRLLVRHG